MSEYDLVIIGGGPAGLTAGIYASRARLKTLLIEKALPGGQILSSPLVENYPGLTEGISGAEMIEEMVGQAKRFGTEIRTETVISVEESGYKGKTVKTGAGSYKAITVILAMGAAYSKLNIPGEDKLSGRGVSYCATCDGPLFRNKEVVVVGGGDTAIEEALCLTKFCVKVTIIHRRDELRATKILQERAFADQKINIMWNSVATETLGEQKLEGIMLKDVKTGKETLFATSGVFIAVGFTPHTELASGLVMMDEKGYIITNDDMETSREGLFAAGDCRKKLLRQVISACGDGATAAFAAQKYIEGLKG